MDGTTRQVRRPRPGPAWSVQSVAHRERWCDASEACAACGTSVDLWSPHEQVELIRHRENPTGKRRFDRERLSFCDDRCCDRWLSLRE